MDEKNKEKLSAFKIVLRLFSDKLNIDEIDKIEIFLLFVSNILDENIKLKKENKRLKTG